MLLLMASAASAMTPFRRHKFDQFDVLPLREGATIFYGNSITNMFEWWEALGCDPSVLNRGVSGAMTHELLENAGCVTRFHPAKVFIGIGTNDLGDATRCNPDTIASNIAGIVSRILSESPSTEIYVQSILPSENGRRTLPQIARANEAIRSAVAPLGATFIDLTDVMAGIATKEISYDGLHVTSEGYPLWLDAIEPFTGRKTILRHESPRDNGGISTNSFGMRNTYFSAYPVGREDVLMIGDEMIHGGEWHELLGDDRVKNRGTGWGYGGLSLDSWPGAVRAMLGDAQKQEAPAAIFLYAGSEDIYKEGVSPEVIASKYSGLLDKIREYAPAEKTRIVVMSLIPRSDASTDEKLTVPFNRLLEKLAAEQDNCQFLDLYTPLETDRMEYLDEDFLTGKGYLEVSRLIRPLLPGLR